MKVPIYSWLICDTQQCPSAARVIPTFPAPLSRATRRTADQGPNQPERLCLAFMGSAELAPAAGQQYSHTSRGRASQSA